MDQGAGPTDDPFRHGQLEIAVLATCELPKSTIVDEEENVVDVVKTPRKGENFIKSNSNRSEKGGRLAHEGPYDADGSGPPTIGDPRIHRRMRP